MATSDTIGRLIVVAGMHRSGTSAVTRALNLLGAYIPEPVVPPFQGNELGHWEPEAVVHMNDRFLAEAGSHVNAALPIAPAWFSSAAAKRATDEISDWLAPHLTAHPLVVIKDPRIALLIRIWNDAIKSLGVTARYVIPFRHPWEVASSLARRQLHFFPGEVWPPERGLLIWLTHVVELERATRGALRTMVGFDAFLADWRPELERMLSQIDLPVEIEAEAAASIDASIRSEARREVADTAQFLPSDMQKALEALEHAASDPRAGSAVLDLIAARLGEAGVLVGSYLSALERASEANSLLAQEAADLQADRDAAIAKASVCRQRLEQARLAAVSREAEWARLARIAQVAAASDEALASAYDQDTAFVKADKLAARADALTVAHLALTNQARVAQEAGAKREAESTARLEAAEMRAQALQNEAEDRAAQNVIRLQEAEARADAANAWRAEAEAARSRLADLDRRLAETRNYAARLAQARLGSASGGTGALSPTGSPATGAISPHDLASDVIDSTAAQRLADELAEEIEARRAAQAHARALEGALQQMRASRSWRLTAPLRRLRGR